MALLHYIQLYSGEPTPGSVQTLYICPTGYRVVVRNVVMSNRYSAAALFTMSVNSARVVTWAGLAAAGSADSSYQWDGRLILVPGDTLSFYIPSPAWGDVMATGSIYSI